MMSLIDILMFSRWPCIFENFNSYLWWYTKM